MGGTTFASLKRLGKDDEKAAEPVASVLPGVVGQQVMSLDVLNDAVEKKSTYQKECFMSDTSNRGFASMDDEKQREIASKGGKAAHEKGTAHEFTPEEAREAGRKGGESVSEDREHMSEIGKKGGETISKDREHMSDIGREGGKQSHKED